MESPTDRQPGSPAAADGWSPGEQRATGRTSVTEASFGPIPLPAAGGGGSGDFPFEGDPQLAKYQWPYFAVSGARPGKRFLLTAGIHAAEYTGTLAALRLGRLLQPATVN